MRKFALIAILCSFCAAPAMAADAVTAEVSKLQALKLETVKTADENTKLTEADMKAQDEVFEALEGAVQAAVKKTTPELDAEILRVTVEMLKKDPTQFAGELVLPLYEKNKKSFLESLKKLSPSDAKLVEDAVKAAARQKRYGNG
ncbi:phosphoenolpyruvate carboxylase [Bdellovibrio bacteriovorus]|uniref:Phosphoenolpyruvate carboxylase n=1 Tax=Bdellovibrio bacteriovorus TaxID=959 RepID=A0A1Z3NAL3_BDEBC|nr:phosphoenolpyruvate carboxylase [Bdellovibrio bacteriovorus]ASD64487.1 phosphoenolpyruvate carboxylase [Bdellovibrio bacteriovorus]